ncbi:MAG: hypothetical protein P9L93_04675 [Candidatus Gorgyraea atricola]|nr:hypothetical protein [Candidatus Gorgyraea atricola]
MRRLGKKGLSLVEITVAMGIMMAVFALIFTIYMTAHKLWRGGFTQIAFQSRGRIMLSRIADNLRSATGATIFDSGDRVRFVTDPNRTPETLADDVSSEYYVSGNDIIYDPDISIAGDETSVLQYVSMESAIPFFQISGDLVVITFRLFNTDAIYGTHWSGMSTSIKMRNV